jgi:hypothetical protein
MTPEEKPELLGEEQTPDFCVHIQFRKETARPQRILTIASTFIDTLEGLDRLLATSISSSLHPVFVLENIETGSIKLWIKQAIEAVDDDALKDMSLRKQIGHYLVKGKYALLEKMGYHKSLPPKQELETLSHDLHGMAEKTGLQALNCYRHVTPVELAQQAQAISIILTMLQEKEAINFACDAGDTRLTNDIKITDEAVNTLFVAREIENHTTLILRVRRPDFLGSARWEFRYNKASFSARFGDEEWLKEYQKGEIDIRPGDALEVVLLEKTAYSAQGEVVKEEKIVEKVLNVIRAGEQTYLKLPTEPQ